MPKRKAPTTVQEVTLIPKKTRRGGRKVELQVVPGSPATPASSNGRASFSTPTQSSMFRTKLFVNGNDGKEKKTQRKKKKTGSVCNCFARVWTSIEQLSSHRII
jgi:hypothetical protein